MGLWDRFANFFDPCSGEETLLASYGIPMPALIAIVGVFALGLVYFYVAAKRGRVDGRKYLPQGDPGKDCERLSLWWKLEFESAGLAGEPAVDHETWAESAKDPGRLRGLLGTIAGRMSLEASHVYRTRIPAPAPLEAFVFTTDDGMIPRVIYLGTVRRKLSGTVAIEKPPPWAKFAGPGADDLNADHALLKAARATLSLGYPLRFIPQTFVSRESARLELTPSGEESSLVIDTTVIEHDLTFGLKFVMAVQRQLQGAGA